MLPTPTGVGFTVGFDGTGAGHPAPLTGTDALQTKLRRPVTFGPNLLTKASLSPPEEPCSGVDPGAAATGKLGEKVSPVT